MPAAAPASTPSAPTAPTGATETFALAVPIVDDAGRSYRTLTLVEPSLRHDAQIARRGLKGASAQTAAMVAALSGVPESATINLKLRDARRLKHWLNATERRAVVADMAAELAAAAAARDAGLPSPDLTLETPRTFTLLVPVVPTGADPITTVTLREPDLAAGVAIEKFELEPDQTAAMIATLSGLTIPIVMSMKTADVTRMERWLNFFSEAGDPSPALPTTTDELPAASAAGEAS